MKQLQVVLVNVKQAPEVKNVLYPAHRPGGIWQSITRMLASVFSSRKHKRPSYPGACVTCIYWQDWKCLKHRIEKAATGPRCKEYIDVTSMPLPDVVAIRKKLSY